MPGPPVLGPAAVIGIVLVLGLISSPATGLQSAEAELDALVDDFVELETETGTSGAGALRRENFLAGIDARRDLLGRVESVDPEALSRPARIDRVLMIGLLRADAVDAERRRPWENEPSRYVPSRRIGTAVEAVKLGAEGATSRLGELLETLPATLGHGRADLGRPPRRFTEEAIFQAERTLEDLESVAAAPPTDMDVASLDAAVVELRDFLGFLREELLPRSDGDWAVGTDHYDFLLRTRWLLDDDAEGILARGRRAFEETEAAAQEVAGRIEPGRHWVEVYERLKDDHPPADRIKEAYQEQMDAARAFVRRERVVSLPEGESVVTVDTPPALRRSSPFGTFDTVGPFEEGLRGRLVLTPIEDWLSREQRRERLRSHHRAWIPLIAVHEAYPGHHTHALKANQNPRPLRRIVRESILAEGWGLYTEQLMWNLGFLQGDDVELTQLRNRLWRAARVILDVSLHTGRMSVDEAVDFLVERVRFERYAAELEVAMYPRRPTYVLGYLIGMQEIERLRDDWVEAHGEPSPPAELWDPFLTAGAIPPALVRAELLGEPVPTPGRR